MTPEREMTSPLDGRYLIDGRLEVQVTVRRVRAGGQRDAWLAVAKTASRDGTPREWAALASEDEAERRLRAKSARVGGLDDAVIGKAASRAAQGASFNKVIRDVRTTLDHPAARGAMDVLSSIPYVGPAVSAVRAATNIADQAANGNPRARQNLAQLNRAAQAGNPRARQAIGVVETVLRSQRQMATQRAQPSVRRLGSSPQQERAWTAASRRWNEWRRQAHADGETPIDPLIPPTPRG